MSDIKKITRDQFVTYVDTTPSASETWALLGVGITEYGIAYNPQVTTEKWIIHKNANSSLDSYQRQADASQKCYKGDAVFEYINELRRTCGIGAEVQTHVLDIDRYDVESAETTPKYKATKCDAIIVITKYMSDDAVIEYSIYYNGDPVQGTVTFTEEVPTFVANA